MRPVNQRKYVPGREPSGDCFSACLASLLECQLEEVPIFSNRPPGKWCQDVNDWLRPRGYYLVGYSAVAECTPPPPDFHIVSGPTRRAPGQPGGHAIIARGNVPIHDPSGTGESIEQIEYRWHVVPFDKGQARSAGSPPYIWYRDRTMLIVIAIAFLAWLAAFLFLSFR